MLLGALAEGLELFGGIDAGEPDFLLDLIHVEHGDGVAVGHTDHPAAQGFSLSGPHQPTKGQGPYLLPP